MVMYYDRDGRPMANGTAWQAMEDRQYKVVNQTVLPNGLWVSTVWLGLDHRMADDGPPLIFETMVFPAKENLAELACERHATLLEAAIRHEVLCEQWRTYEGRQGDADATDAAD